MGSTPLMPSVWKSSTVAFRLISGKSGIRLASGNELSSVSLTSSRIGSMAAARRCPDSLRVDLPPDRCRRRTTRGPFSTAWTSDSATPPTCGLSPGSCLRPVALKPARRTCARVGDSLVDRIDAGEARELECPAARDRAGVSLGLQVLRVDEPVPEPDHHAAESEDHRQQEREQDHHLAALSRLVLRAASRGRIR